MAKKASKAIDLARIRRIIQLLTKAYAVYGPLVKLILASLQSAGLTAAEQRTVRAEWKVKANTLKGSR